MLIRVYRVGACAIAVLSRTSCACTELSSLRFHRAVYILVPTCYLSRSASCFVLNNVIFPGLGTEEAGISDVHTKMLGRWKSP